MNGAPENGTVSLYMDADQIVARLGVVHFAHGIECQIMDAVETAFIPGVDMTAEDAGCIPFFKLLQKEERLFPGTDDENQ